MWCKMVLHHKQGENSELIELSGKEEAQVASERSGKFGKSSL